MTSPLNIHWRKLYENKYLGAWDLWDAKAGRYREVQARIDRVTQEEVVREGGERSSPLLLYLSGKKGPIRTPMIVTKTSGKTLQGMFGPVYTEWVGKTITLYAKQKRTRDGKADVLTIRGTSRGEQLKDELRGGTVQAPISEDEFDDAGEREPGMEG